MPSRETVAPPAYPPTYPQAGDNLALQRVYEALWAHGSKWEAGQDWRCVAHDDHRASLGVKEGDSQLVMFKCQAGCTFSAIVAALDLSMSDVMMNIRYTGAKGNGTAQPRRQRESRSPRKTPERVRDQHSKAESKSDHTLSDHIRNDTPSRIRKWTYTDVSGAPTVIVRRRDYDCAEHPKAIDQLKVNGVRPADAPYDLYRLKDVRVAAAARRRVLLVAGEPSVDAAIEAGLEERRGGKAGYTVTTMRGGEKPGAWLDSYSQTLQGTGFVLVVADRDLTGYRHALAVVESLKANSVPCRVALSATERAHDDLVDHLSAGFGLADLVPIKLAELKTRILELEQQDAQGFEPVAKKAKRGSDAAKSGNLVKQMEFSEAYLADFIANEHVFSDKFVWNMGWGWLRWNGKRWALCSEVSVIEGLRKFVITWMAKEGRRGAEPERLAKLLALLSRSKITNIVTLLRGRLERDASDFDADHDMLNCLNGVVNLRTGALGEHDPKLFMTKIAGVDYKVGARHPDWTTALKALPLESRTYLLQRFGQALTGYPPPDDKLVILHGQGWNGKSTITIAVFKALGGYGSMIPKSLLTPGARDAHSTDKMTLQGVRFAFIEELPDERKLDVAALKDAVGTPVITGRPLFGKHITFPATHSLFVNTNYTPIVTQTDLGTWRRLERIVFPYTYRLQGQPIESPMDRRSDPLLRPRIEVDPQVWEAALAALVEAAGKWYAAGKIMPVTPPSVIASTQAWRVDEDYVLRFFSECMEFDPERHVAGTDLFHEFNEWLDQTGNKGWTDRTLSARLKGHDVLSRQVEHRKMQKRSSLSVPRNGSGRAQEKGAYWAWAGVKFK